MRIAIDIDSTLHHYWDTLSEIAVRRFGIELPYEEQFTWGITRLKPEQLRICIEESHCDERILAGVPYPGAVETVRRWHEAEGHYIHVTSHRDARCAAASERWLREIGVPFDDVCCSWDKVSRCEELRIDLLIDDSPLNLTARARTGDRGRHARPSLEPGRVRRRGRARRGGLAGARARAGTAA